MDHRSYEHELFKDSKNYFIDPWGGVIVKNFNPKKKKLASFSSMKEYKRSNIQLWIRCNALVFRDPQQQIFPVFACETCDKMLHLDTLSLNQTREQIRRYQCVHSIAAEKIVKSLGEWQELFQVDFTDMEIQDECYKVQLNEQIQHVTLESDNEKGSFLALVRMKSQKKVSILSSINSRTLTPVCLSVCSRKPCKCFWRYKKLVESEIRAQHPGQEIEIEHYWQNRKTMKSVPKHYDEEEPVHHNITRFTFPVKKDPFLHQKFQEKLQGNLQIPSKIIPPYNEEYKCKHNNSFISSDDALFEIAKKSTIYSAMSETTSDSIIVFGRRSNGSCKCVQQPDTHELLLWNLGNGRLIEYEYLLSSLHQWYAGQTYTSQVSARKTFFDNLSRETTLTSSDLDNAVTGLVKLCNLDRSIFECKDCGDTPKYIIGKHN